MDYTPLDSWDTTHFATVEVIVLSNESDFEFLKYDGVIYKKIPPKEAEAVGENKAEAAHLLGQITEQNNGDVNLADYTPSNLPIGTELYSPTPKEEKPKIIVAETEKGEIFYRYLLELPGAEQSSLAN